jgi:hypothetical protein
LREAARHGGGISPDARHPQPLLALAAALTDLRDLTEAEDILHAADNPALHGIPAQAALCILRARIHLAGGRPEQAAAEGQAALAIAAALGAHGYASTARTVLAVIELRRGDVGAAAGHLASRHETGPQFAKVYAHPEATLAEAQVTEARDGPAAALGHLRRLCADLEARPGLLLGDPALAPWLVRTALAAGESELAAAAARAAQALATPTRDSRPWPRPRRTAAAWPAVTRPCWPRPPRSTPTRGPGPRPPRTSASCTAVRATGTGRSTT